MAQRIKSRRRKAVKKQECNGGPSAVCRPGKA